MEKEYGPTDEDTVRVTRRLLNLRNELRRHGEEMELVEHFEDLRVTWTKKANTDAKTGDVDLAASIEDQDDEKHYIRGEDLKDDRATFFRKMPNKWCLVLHTIARTSYN